MLRTGSRSPLPVGVGSEPLAVKRSGTLNSAFNRNSNPYNLNACRGQSPMLNTA